MCAASRDDSELLVSCSISSVSHLKAHSVSELDVGAVRKDFGGEIRHLDLR